jgi:hypothetical protein
MLLHLFYCVVWFWFLFVLDLKIYLNGLENKCKKRRAYLLPGGLEARPSRPASPFPRCWAVEAEPAFPRSSSRPRGPAQESQHARPPFLVSLTNRPHMSVASLFSVSWPSQRRARSQPNQNRFSRDFNPNWGVPTLYKLEPSLPPSFLLGFWVVALP